MKKIIFIITIVATVSSCKVYTKYERPDDLPVSSSYRGVNEESDTTTLASLSWKEMFTDSYLQTLIKIGLEKNTDLRIARLSIEQAEASLKSAKLAYLPSANLSPEGTISSFDGSKPSKTYSLGVSASWEIEVFGKLTNQKREAIAAVESSQAYKQAVETKLVATIANSYYNLLMLDRQLSISLSTLDNWDNSIKTMELLKRAGQSNDVSILQAKANRLSLESAVLQTQRSINEMENSLSVLLGLNAQHIERGVLDKQNFPDSLSIGIPLQLLGHRPDVRQAESDLAQSFYATNVARTAFYPSITLSGSAGWTNSLGGTIVNPGNLLLSAVGSLVQPIFNKGINTANLKIAKAKQEKAKLLFQQSILNAGQAVNDALMQYQTAQNRISIGEQQIEALQKAVDKTELLMKHSSTNYLEVLTAQQSLLQAEQTQVQNYFDKIQGLSNLYHALGGGISE
jgi:NodT family efflux transporter outer membrane factor (OMF) lipoprotein